MVEGPARVLCVCTGNICRSPAMELYLKRAWKDDAVVASAGTYAEVGWEMPDLMLDVLAEQNLNGSSHEPRQLELAELETADLVLAAANDHRAWIARTAGALPPNTFLATEAAALTVFASRPEFPDRADRIRAAAPALAAARVQLGEVHRVDVGDPFGFGLAAHQRTMQQIVAALDTLTAWIG